MALTQTVPRETFERALAALRSGKFAQAGPALAACLQAEPTSAEFAVHFLDLLTRRGSETLAAEVSPADNAAWQAALETRQWNRVAQLGPARLLAQPHNRETLLALTQAATALGSATVAIAYLRRAVALAPHDSELARQLARRYSQAQWWAEALAAWEAIEVQLPGDAEATRALAQHTIERSRARQGWEASSPAENLPSCDTAALPDTSFEVDEFAAEEEASAAAGEGSKRTPLQRLEAELREYPNRVDIYLNLAKAYLRHGRDFDAERILAAGRTATDDAPAVRELWENIALERWEKKCEFAEQHARTENTPEAQESLAANRASREKFELDVFAARCERQPHEAATRVQFGQRLRRAGKLREAGKQFEAAQHDPAWAAQASREAGECLAQLGDIPQALRQLRRAAQFARQAGNGPELRTALRRATHLAAALHLYRLAALYAQEWLRCEPHSTEAAAELRAVEQAAVAEHNSMSEHNSTAEHVRAGEQHAAGEGPR